ncbi:sigma-70 family RNA polymerase sigma factor [Lentisphaerota bacterium ZTH]|nr:sigma-70 family RNA polymerase sigma factor [Lentisphaerota bacterium]WET05191.1 sigma-70 family RNA polymerase sigma factor [Lentisphaerota bacterium ZTH]
MERSDRDLIKGYLSGNAVDFELLYEKYKRQVYSFLLNMLSGQESSIDDIFQQVWIKAVNKLGSYHHQDRFLSWVIKIARNSALDHFRKQQRQSGVELDCDEVPELSDPTGSEPWRELDRAELSVLLGKAVRRLPLEQREVFMLRQEDISFKEIANIQKCSINTALARMQYAVRNLRKTLSGTEVGGIENERQM